LEAKFLCASLSINHGLDVMVCSRPAAPENKN